MFTSNQNKEITFRIQTEATPSEHPVCYYYTVWKFPRNSDNFWIFIKHEILKLLKIIITLTMDKILKYKMKKKIHSSFRSRRKKFMFILFSKQWTKNYNKNRNKIGFFTLNITIFNNLTNLEHNLELRQKFTLHFQNDVEY
jgi:hypothetical protein